MEASSLLGLVGGEESFGLIVLELRFRLLEGESVSKSKTDAVRVCPDFFFLRSRLELNSKVDVFESRREHDDDENALFGPNEK